MKILFLQLWYDFYGGVETVNDTLATQFKKDGFDVSILCLWECENGERVFSGNYIKSRINFEPKKISKKEIVDDLKRFSFNKLKDRIKSYKQKREDKKRFSEKIKDINPDFIIVSNYELIKLVPDNLLKKTVLHMHSNVDTYLNTQKELKLLKYYQNKINKIIWLTDNFTQKAKKHGIYNSIFMSNPVRFKTDIVNQLDNKNITFIGRLSPEKRVGLLTEIYKKSNLNSLGFKLNIYGTGDTSDIVLSDGIYLKGGTSDVKSVLLNSSILSLTSATEGFPMVILEAYECGVPVIVYDYGDSSSEIIDNGKTGYIIDFDNEEEYIKKLKLLCVDDLKRKEMGMNGKEFVKDFYPENVARKWYKLFKGELK